MPDLRPFIIAGLSLGSVYALSGVGLVVLYRATGVLNFANGAYGAVAALTTWQLTESGVGQVPAIATGVLLAAALSGAYGLLINPWFAERESIERASATLGFALSLLGVALLIWSDDPRILHLSTSDSGFQVWGVYVNYTQVVALALAVVVALAAGGYLRSAQLGKVMRALATDRQLTRMLGAPVRRAEGVAWIGSGLLAGAAGVLFANLVSLQASALTFLVIGTMATAVIGRFRSLTLTLVGGVVIGLAQAMATPFDTVTQYREMAPYVVAIAVIALIEIVRPGTERQL